MRAGPESWGLIVDEIDRVFRQPDRDPALVAGYTGQLALESGRPLPADFADRLREALKGR